MLREQPALEKLGAHHLHQIGSVRIRGRLGVKQAQEHVSLGIAEAEAAARREYLRKAVGIHRVPRSVIILYGPQRLSAVAQLLIGVVLKDDDVVFAPELSQPFAPVRRQRLAGGILERGDDVNELGVQLLYLALHILHDHALIVALHRHASGLEHLEYLHAVDESRRLDKYHVAGVDIQLAHEVHRFQAAVDDGDLVRRGVQPFRLQQHVHHGLPQVGHAGYGAILQRFHAAPVARQHLVADLAQLLHG